MKKNKKTIANLIFIVAIAVIMIVCFVYMIIAPVDINEYENRTAEKLETLNISNYLNSKFQDSVELALGDQIPGAIEMKKFYNNSFSKFTSGILQRMLDKQTAKVEKEKADSDKETSGPAIETQSAIQKPTEPALKAIEIEETADKQVAEPIDPNTFAYVGSYWLHKGHLMYGQNSLKSVQDALDLHAKNINKIAEQYPDKEVYVFYLEKETDIKFQTGVKTGAGPYFLNKLTIPKENRSLFEINNFDEFDEMFYKTDHHWNYKGSYKAYTTLLPTLLPGATALKPTEEVYLGKSKGSRTDTDATASYQEDFYVYDFDFPEFKVYSSGKLLGDYGGTKYGNQKKMIEKAKESPLSQVAYATYYGGDVKEILIENVNGTGNGNILVLGSSYDNACLKLLASHYDKLYCVDFRYWPAAEDSDRINGFSLKNYLAEHEDIDKILFFGDIAYYKAKTFYVYE